MNDVPRQAQDALRGKEALLPLTKSPHGLSALASFVDGVEDAALLGSDKWGLTVPAKNTGQVYLYVGSLVCGSIGCGLAGHADLQRLDPPAPFASDSVLWLVLGAQSELAPETQEVCGDRSRWLWAQPEGFQPISSSIGYYAVGARHAESWPSVLAGWRKGLGNAGAKYEKLQSRYQELHVPELVDWLESQVSRDLPRPAY